MLNENIKTIRKNKGYSQEELAIRLHVTRQTISKWEKGTSVPDADLLMDMAEILEVSVSELLGEEPVERKQDALIEQLSRINEQMAIRNRRSSRIIKVSAAVLIVLAVAAMVILGNGYAEKHRLISDHIGKLAYTIPDRGFTHGKHDIGTWVEKDGRTRISAKSYKRADDMTEISIWDYGYNTEVIDDFKEEHKNDMVDYSGDYGDLPAEIEMIVAATDADDDYLGSYYMASIMIGGNIYRITVVGGDAPYAYGEQLICSMHIDENLSEEYL